ncbi:MAG: hypothetical protein FWC89_13245 [Defluviitaleaceae bacterium]|nr:hypothetical protein [Defluviitaleaceae bacterium]
MQKGKSKATKLIISFFGAVMLCLGLVACRGQLITGVWEWNQDILAYDEVIGVIQRVIEFTENNEFITTENSEIIAEGTFSVDGNTIILYTSDLESGAEYPFRWENGNLILYSFHEEMILIRR